MGTAPDHRQTPAMPDPHRTVGRSIFMLTELGFSEDNAAAVVTAVARKVITDLAAVGIDNVWWLEQIAADADSRAKLPNP